jgi:hypothetical protein
LEVFNVFVDVVDVLVVLITFLGGVLNRDIFINLIN